MPLMDYTLHGIPIHFETDDARIARRLQRQWAPFASLPHVSTGRAIHIHLKATPEPPPPPSYLVVSESPTVVYYREGPHLVPYFRRWGRYDVDLEAGTISGVMTEACLSTYGIFEDMIIFALAPLLRRQGYYTIHAFAADLEGRAVAVVGEVGSGKTTTGLSLLAYGGGKLIANDSPLLRLSGPSDVTLCAYPGLLSTYPESIAWFPELDPVLASAERLDGSEKLSFAVDDIWPGRWAMCSSPALLVFPNIVPGLRESRIRPLGRFDALQRMAGQSIENWDKDTIPDQLRALRTLVDVTRSYELDLAPDVQSLHGKISAIMAE